MLGFLAGMVIFVSCVSKRVTGACSAGRNILTWMKHFFVCLLDFVGHALLSLKKVKTADLSC